MPPELTGLLLIIALAYLIRNYLRPALARVLGARAAAGSLSTLAGRLQRLEQAVRLLGQPAAELPAAADCATAVEAEPADGVLLRVALGAATATDWAALAEALPELPEEERLRLGFEVVVRGVSTTLEPVSDGPLASCERALQAAEVEQAYAALDQHGPSLPLVARLPLQARLAVLAEDLELLERTREEALRTPGDAPPEVVADGLRTTLAPLRERWRPTVSSPWELAPSSPPAALAALRATLDEGWWFAETATEHDRSSQTWRGALVEFHQLPLDALLNHRAELVEAVLDQVDHEVLDAVDEIWPVFDTARRIGARSGLGELAARALLNVVGRRAEPEFWPSLLPRSAPWLLTLPTAEPHWPWLAAGYLQWRWLGRLPRSPWPEPGPVGHRAGCVVLQATLREVVGGGAGPWTWALSGAPPLDAAVLDAACVALLDDLTARTSELVAGRYAHGLAQAFRLWSVGLGR